MSTPEPTLKCVIAWSDLRDLCGLVEGALRAKVDEGEIQRLNEDCYLIYTNEETSEIRDLLASILRDGGSVLVIDFEKWSGHGPGVDSRWLMRRGH